MKKIDFPQQSIDKARAIASEYKQRSRSKLELALRLYKNQFLQFAYGINESLRQGRIGSYLHEIKKEADCFTFVGCYYLIARELGLKPKMYSVSGMKDLEEGIDSSDSGSFDHSFITFEYGKEIHVLDPTLEIFGKAKFFPNENRIQIYNQLSEKLFQRTYNCLHEMSEEEYISKLEKNRSVGGGRVALQTTRKIRNEENRSRDIYLTFLPPDKLRSSIHLNSIQFFPEPYNICSILDLSTKVNDNGQFDFNEGKLSFYHVMRERWDEHQGAQIPVEFSVKNAQKILDIWKEIVRRTGKRKSLKCMNIFKLNDLLLNSGFLDNFTIQEGSLASKVISDLGNGYLDFMEEEKSITNDFIEKAKKHEITYRVLLRDAHYCKKIDVAKTKDNPRGLIFSEEQRIDLLKQAFREYKNQTKKIYRLAIENAKTNLELKKGSRYHQSRKMQRQFEMSNGRLKYFHHMSTLRKSSFPFAFHEVADESLFREGFDINGTIEKLEQGISEEDLKRASKRKLFYGIIDFGAHREILFMASYHQGLEKILSLKV